MPNVQQGRDVLAQVAKIGGEEKSTELAHTRIFFVTKKHARPYVASVNYSSTHGILN